MWVVGYGRCQQQMTLYFPVEKFISILYANYHARCFHRCELTDSTSAAIQKDKKGCVSVCAFFGGMLPNRGHVINFNFVKENSNMIVLLKQFKFI